MLGVPSKACVHINQAFPKTQFGLSKIALVQKFALRNLAVHRQSTAKPFDNGVEYALAELQP